MSMTSLDNGFGHGDESSIEPLSNTKKNAGLIRRLNILMPSMLLAVMKPDIDTLLLHNA